MTERESAERPIIHHLFPVREMSVFTAYHKLFVPFRRGNTKPLGEELDYLVNTDEVLVYRILEGGENVEKFSHGKARNYQYNLGAMTTYRAFREEAVFRGGILPKITDDILETHFQDSADVEWSRERNKNSSPFDIVDGKVDQSVELQATLSQVDEFYRTEKGFRKFFPRSMFSSPDYGWSIVGIGMLEVYNIYKTNSEIEKTKELLSR
jgi:hypothetical protein